MFSPPFSSADVYLPALRERGFAVLDAPTVRALSGASAAGVAEGTLYRHFPSKDDLLIEVYRGIKRAVFEAISDGEAGDEASEQ